MLLTHGRARLETVDGGRGVGVWRVGFFQA